MEISRITYDAVCNSEALQERITQAVYSLCEARGVCTPAQLGYLHMANVTSTPYRGVEVRLYFATELALDELKKKKRTFVVNSDLNVFQNFFFVGPLTDVVSIEKINCQKYKIRKDEDGIEELIIRDKLDTEERLVVVLHCNLDLVMATIHNINLKDPNFKVDVNVVNEDRKKKHQVMIMGNVTDEHAVQVTVQMTEDSDEQYDENGAIPYLIKLRDKQNELAQVFDQVKHSAKNKTKKAKKEAKKESKAGKKVNKLMK